MQKADWVSNMVGVPFVSTLLCCAGKNCRRFQELPGVVSRPRRDEKNRKRGYCWAEQPSKRGCDRSSVAHAQTGWTSLQSYFCGWDC